MSDKYNKDRALSWIKIMKKQFGDNKSITHTLDALENDLKRELPSKELSVILLRTALMKSIVNSTYGLSTSIKSHELKGKYCDVVCIDEEVW